LSTPFLTLFTLFLLFDNILSVRLPIYFSAPIIALLSFPIYLQGFWSVTLDKNFTQEIISTSFISSLITTEIAVSLFFWPVTIAVGSLFLTLTAYVMLGLGQSNLEGRLFKGTVRDYILVAVIVFIGMYFLTSWSGL